MELSLILAGVVHSGINERSGVDGEAFAGCHGLLRSQGSEGGTNKLINRDGGRSLLPDGPCEGGPLAAMPLVLMPARADHLLAAIAQEFKTTKIFSTATAPPPNASTRSFENERSPFAR